VAECWPPATDKRPIDLIYLPIWLANPMLVKGPKHIIPSYLWLFLLFSAKNLAAC
jgi:hypothetical protein